MLCPLMDLRLYERISDIFKTPLTELIFFLQAHKSVEIGFNAQKLCHLPIL